MQRGHAQRCSDETILCFWETMDNDHEPICCVCDCGLKLDYIVGGDNTTMFQYADGLRCPSSEAFYKSMLCGKILLQYQSQISTILSSCTTCKKTKDRLLFKNQPPSVFVEVDESVGSTMSRLIFTSSSGQKRAIVLELCAKTAKNRTGSNSDILFTASEIVEALTALCNDENITLCNWNTKQITCFECLQKLEAKECDSDWIKSAECNQT